MDMITLAMAKAYSDSQRLAYTEPSKIIFSEQLENGNLQTEKSIDLVVGAKYTIFLTNGEEKLLLATSIVPNATNGIVWLGNLSLIFGNEVENTGESYAMISVPTQETIIITGTSSNDTIIIEREEGIHPIDPKYLPAESLPNIIDATQFPCHFNGTDMTLNDAVLQALFLCLQNGTAQRVGCEDDGELHDALKKNVNCKLRFFDSDSIIESAVSVVYNDSNIAYISCGFIITVYGVGYVDVSMCVDLVKDGDGYDIVMRATPLGV